MKRLPKVLSLDDLKKLNTSRLLNYLKSLQQCEESFEKSDWDTNTDLDNDDTIQYKQTEKWKVAYKNVKSNLNKREHIEKKKASL